MLAFECDYNQGAHEAILKRLLNFNGEKMPGYGEDALCDAAAQKIREACQCPQAQVRFLVGGTQTNQTVIDAMLAPYEGVISAQSGHVNVHESGAIEATGHKVLPLPQRLGKLDAAQVRAFAQTFWQDDTREHMVFPGMVYISHPTEYGTLYTKAELEALRRICDEFGMRLYLDGARLGYGLMSPETDVTLPDVARLCDVFYIGGTKVGALFGEAVVFTRENAPAHLTARIKQHGALLAKGWLLGLQFDTLFTDGLYFEISRHAVEAAMALRDALREKGYPFLIDSPTNQQFIVLTNEKYAQLAPQVRMSVWEHPDEAHTAVRLATSWATTQQDLDALLALL